MEKLFVVSILITVLFCVVKFIEMKYIQKEWKPLKLLVRDAFIVFICSITSLFVYFQLDGTIHDFFNVVTENKVLNPSATQVFTDEPGF